MTKITTRLEYLWMRLKSKTPSLFNYANLVFGILVAIITYLKIEQASGNIPEELVPFVNYSHLVIGAIGVILLKLPTKDKTLQSDKPITEKVAIKKQQNNEQEEPLEEQVRNVFKP